MTALLLLQRRLMRRSSAWTYRCAAGHSVTVSVRGHEEPVEYGALFGRLHSACREVAL